MKLTESKQTSSVPVRACEFKIKPALLRRLAPLTLFLCVAVVCAALPAAAQTLTVDNNPAYVGENLTFIYTPGDCMDSEAVTFTRDVTIYTGDEKSFDIQLTLNSDGPYSGLYTGTHTTTADDVGNDVIAIDDDCNESVEPVQLTVARFDGFFVYQAAKIDEADAVTLKSNPTVEVDAMLTPTTGFAASLIDWSSSGGGINWRLDNWGGYAYTSSPYDYYFCATLDEATWHDLDVWVIWATVTPRFTDNKTPYDSGTDTGDQANFPYYAGGTELGAENQLTDYSWLGFKTEIKGQLAPSGVNQIIKSGWVFYQTVTYNVFLNNTSASTGSGVNAPDTVFNSYGADMEDKTPDPNDQIFVLDGPGAYNFNTIKQMMNFQTWVYWNGQVASDPAQWWIRKKAERNGSGYNVIENTGDNGTTTIDNTYTGN